MQKHHLFFFKRTINFFFFLKEVTLKFILILFNNNPSNITSQGQQQYNLYYPKHTPWGLVTLASMGKPNSNKWMHWQTTSNKNVDTH